MPWLFHAVERAIWQLPLLLIVGLLIVQVLVNAPLKIKQLEQQGGRGSMTRLLNLVAWASVPIIIQLVVQVVYVLTTGKLIVEQGLGGFAPVDPDGSVVAHALLSRVTLYWLWEIVLLMIGVKLFANINTRKAIIAVVVTAAIVLGLRILPDVIGAQLGGLTVSQPFPFF